MTSSSQIITLIKEAQAARVRAHIRAMLSRRNARLYTLMQRAA